MDLFQLNNQLRHQMGLATVSQESQFDVDINFANDGGSSATLSESGLTPVTSSGNLTPEAAEVEVEEAAVEADAVSAAESQTQEDAEALESYMLFLENSLQNSGISVESAQLLHVGVDSIMKRYSVSSKELLPSMEDFSDNTYHTTKVSMEKIGAALGAVKKTGGELLTKFWEAIKSVFEKIRKFLFPSVRDRLEKLKEESKKKRADGPPEVTLKSNAALFVGKTTIDEFLTFVNEIESTVANYKGVVDTVNKYRTADIDSSEEAVIALIRAVNKVVSDGKGVFKSRTRNGENDISFIAELPYGGATVEFSRELGAFSNGIGPKELMEFTPRFKLHVQGKEYARVTTKAFSSGDMLIVANRGIQILDNLENLLKSVDRGNFKDVFKNLDRSDVKGRGDMARVFNNRRRLTKQVVEFIKSLLGYAGKVLKGYIAICAASMGQEEKEDKKSK